jgi:hypothetical protein
LLLKFVVKRGGTLSLLHYQRYCYTEVFRTVDDKQFSILFFFRKAR